MAEHFFTGATQGGRELRLFYEHTAFDQYDTADGHTTTRPRRTSRAR
jgi:hypothetical protein